jgi:hypothetical protein
MSRTQRPRSIWLIAAGLLAWLAAGSPARSEDPAPTLAKCSCHLDEHGPPDSLGARATNATLCVQMLDQGHKWCEITVACLRGNMGPQSKASGAPKQALLPLFEDAAQQVAQAGGAPATFMAPQLSRAKDAIAKLTATNDGPINDCVAAYSARSREDKRQSRGEASRRILLCEPLRALFTCVVPLLLAAGSRSASRPVPT